MVENEKKPFKYFMGCVRIYKSGNWGGGGSASIFAHISVSAFDAVLFCEKLETASYMVYWDEAI